MQSIRNTKFMGGKTSQQPLQEEDEATILRRRMEEEINEIKKTIKQEFQNEISNNHQKKESSSNLILHNFQKELHLIQSINQRQRMTLHQIEQSQQNNQRDDISEKSEDTQIPEDHGQFVYSFNKPSYQSATFDFFPLKSEYFVKDIRDKLQGLQEQQITIETCVVSEEQNNSRLHVSFKEVEEEHSRIKQQVEQTAKMLAQFSIQQEETHDIHFQAMDQKNDTNRTLKEIKKKINQIDFVESRYKEKKQQILYELRKDNDFYENTLSKLRLQIQEKLAVNKLLEDQLQEINGKEESRNKATNDQNIVTDYIMTFQKLQKYFLDGEIYHNPQTLEEFRSQNVSEYKIVSQREQREVIKSSRVVSSHNKRKPTIQSKKNMMKSMTFITSVEDQVQELPTTQRRLPDRPVKTMHTKHSVITRFSIEDQLTFFKSIEYFVSMYPEGIYLLATNILKEFYEMRNEAGILEILYCFLTKQIEQHTAQLEHQDQEIKLCIKSLEVVDPQVQLQIFDAERDDVKVTVNLMFGDNLDTNKQVQLTLDRKNQSQRFTFQIFLTLIENLNRLCNILMKVQDQSQLIPYEFEKQYQIIAVKLGQIKLQPPHRLLRKKHGVDEPNDTPQGSQQIELSNDKIIDTLKDYLYLSLQQVGLQDNMLEDCYTIVKEQVEIVKSDYVCKAFVQKEKIIKFYQSLQYSLSQLTSTNCTVLDVGALLLTHFGILQAELHSLQQSNIQRLLNMNVQLVLSLGQFKSLLAQKFASKDSSLAKQKDKSMVLLKYMNKASIKLQSYFDHVQDETDELHLKMIQEQLNKSIKERPIASHNFVKDLEAISKSRRKVAISKLHKLGHSTQHEKQQSDQFVQTEEDVFENERLKYKTFYEQTSHYSAIEERQRVKLERFELQQKNLVFNRLTNMIGQSKILLEDKEHLRSISKNSEVLFKIKQLNKNSKRIGKETLIQDLNQDRMQKEKIYKREFNANPLQSKKVGDTKAFFNIESFEAADDDEVRSSFLAGQKKPQRASIYQNRASVQDISKLESKRKSIMSVHPFMAPPEVRPKSQSANKMAQVKLLIIKEVISPPTNEDLIDDFDRMSPKSQSKYSIQAMAASPYIRQFKNPSLSVGALSKYFSKDQVKQLQSNQSKYNFQMKK